MKIDWVSYSDLFGEIILFDRKQQVRVTLHIDDLKRVNLVGLIKEMIKNESKNNKRKGRV